MEPIPTIARHEAIGRDELLVHEWRVRQLSRLLPLLARPGSDQPAGDPASEDGMIGVASPWSAGVNAIRFFRLLLLCSVTTRVLSARYRVFAEGGQDLAAAALDKCERCHL